jgi:serine/threonine-protein kinase
MRPAVPGFELVSLASAATGASEIWRAIDRHGRAVALKILRSDRPDLALRFEQEGRLLLALGGSHHLIGCFGVLDHPPTLILELGTATGPGPAPTALRDVRDAAIAVDWLHRHQVVHRDVKPSNLVRGIDGSIRLTDLGVAAVGDPPRALPPEWIEEDVGTLGFAAPELLRDPASANRLSDVYGLGATLYQLLSSRLPFELGPVESPAELRARIARGDPPTPLAARGNYPEAWDIVVGRALAPDPAERFQSAEEFGAAVGALL